MIIAASRVRVNAKAVLVCTGGRKPPIRFRMHCPGACVVLQTAGLLVLSGPMRYFTACLALTACGMTACSTFEKDPKVVITVHSQGNDMDSPKTIFRRQIEGRQVIFKVIPEFSHESVAAIHPFPADDGTHGVALKLDFKGANALDLVTRMRSGEMLMTMVNGTVVDWVQIDKPIADGIFTIWRGLPEELVAVMEKEYPPIKHLKSSSEFLEMTPSTKKEKTDSRRRVLREEKEKAAEEKAAAKRRARGEFDPEPPRGEAVPLEELLKNP